MTMTQMIVREFAPGHLSPGDSLHLFDRKLSQHLHSDHFITAFYGVLNIRTFTLRYTAAGHVAPLVYSHARQQAKALALVPAYPLRTFTNEKYVEQSIQIEPGDRLLFYTDGVVDLQNPSGHLYGGEKLMHLLEKHHPLECEELLERIIEETERFGAHANGWMTSPSCCLPENHDSCCTDTHPRQGSPVVPDIAVRTYILSSSCKSKAALPVDCKSSPGATLSPELL